jgi:hypothetical protein
MEPHESYEKLFDEVAALQELASTILKQPVTVSVYPRFIAIGAWVGGVTKYETVIGKCLAEACDKFIAKRNEADPDAAELRRRAAELLAKAEAMDAGK